MKELDLESVRYITINGEVWVLPSSVSILRGNKKGNYTNWAIKGLTQYLPGKETRFTHGTPEWRDVITQFKLKYEVVVCTSEDLRLIDKERAEAFLNTDKPRRAISPFLGMNNSKLNLLDMNEPVVSSLEIAEQLGVDHPSLMKTINKYKRLYSTFAPARFEIQTDDRDISGRWKTKEQPDFYLLNEDQAYFLATLSRNTPQVVEFKYWLVSTFSKMRKQSQGSQSFNELLSVLPGNWEGLIQSMLCHLSTYTDTPYRQEVHLKNNWRIDVVMSPTEALEIKNHMIQPCHVKKLVVEKAYWYQLKEALPGFETLYITSTLGVTPEALSFFSMLHPEVKYISLRELFGRFVKDDERLKFLPAT